MDAAGELPLFEWGLNTNSGQIEETTRTNGREKVVDRIVNVDTLKMSDDVMHIKLPARESTPVPVAETQEEEAAVSETDN